MHRGEAVPSKLEFTLGPETRTDERHVLVEANVYPVWWNKGVGGRLSYNGLPRSWRFTARESSLWQIVRVERAIVQVYDRMLCVLYGSRHSRSWLEFEVEAAGGSRCSLARRR